MNIPGSRRSLSHAFQSIRNRLVDPVQDLGPSRIAMEADMPAVNEYRVRLAGKSLSLVGRPGSIDVDLMRMILREESEYRLPAEISPSVIFDVGANIGMAAAYFATVYPQARIYCFEPLPENLELLRVNAARTSPRITVIPCGLSDRTAELEYRYSRDPRNFGGGGFHALGTREERSVTLDVTTAGKAMADLGLDRVDVFKIDTEGHEMAILKGIPEAARIAAQAFIGELHGECDWSFCETLAESHAVGVQKRYQAGCFPFMGIRKDLVASTPARAAA